MVNVLVITKRDREIAQVAERVLQKRATVPLKKFATTAKRQTPSTALGGFGAAGRLEPSVASRQTPGGVGG